MTPEGQAVGLLKMTDQQISDAVEVSERAIRRWRQGGGARRMQRRLLAKLLRGRAEKMAGLATELEDSLV